MDIKKKLTSGDHWLNNQTFSARQSYALYKLSILLLMFVIQFESSWWSTWKEDIYPINHGGYFTNWNEGKVTEEYEYWYLENIYLIDMNIYSNEDILLTYQASFINNPLLADIAPVNNSVLVKIDSTTGTTIWAKEILNYLPNINLQINKSFLLNDTSWSLFVFTEAIILAPGVITKIDSDGNLIETFYVPFDFVKSQTNFFLCIIDFYLFSDQSFITVASCYYTQGEFGVSEYSLSDFWFFKVDSNRTFKWSTSIDFLNGIEERESLFEYNNTVFVSIVTAKLYYCLITLNRETGVVNKWSWSYVYKQKSSSNYRQLVISYISERFVYGYGNSYYATDNFSTSLYLFDPISLKLKLAYTLSNWGNFYGFNVAELNSDAIYCIGFSKLYK